MWVAFAVVDILAETDRRRDVAEEEVTGKRGKLMIKVDQCSGGHCRYSSFSCGYGTGMDWIKLYRARERYTQCKYVANGHVFLQRRRITCCLDWNCNANMTGRVHSVGSRVG